MIRMEMGKQDSDDRRVGNAQLFQSNDDAAPDIENEPLDTGLDESARTEAFDRWVRRASTQEHDTKHAFCDCAAPGTNRAAVATTAAASRNIFRIVSSHCIERPCTRTQRRVTRGPSSASRV